MKIKNKDSVTLRKEANEIRDAARAQLDGRISELKNALEAAHHKTLEGEIVDIMKLHQEEGKSLKGPTGLAARAKKKTEHLAKMGNQKNILRFLKLHAAHDQLEQRLKKEATDQAIAMAAKRVHDLLHS